MTAVSTGGVRELPAAPTRWLVVALIVGAGIVASFQIGKAPVALPVLRAQFGTSLVAAAWIISMFNVLGAACGALVGAVTDRLGHRRAMLTGLGIIALASLAGAAAVDTAMLLATRFFEGLGFIVAVIAAPGLIVRATAPSDQRLALGVWSCYVPAGSALMMVMSPPLIAGIGWRGLWLFNTAAVALVAVAVGWATREMPPMPRSDGRGFGAIVADVLRTLRHPGPPALALAFGCYALQYLSVVGFLPTLLIQSDGMGAAAAGTLAALAAAVNAGGNIGGGWLLHRGVPRWLLIAVPSLVMALSGVVIYAAPLPFILRYGAVLVFAAVSGTMPAALLSGAPRHAATPGLVGTTVGLINQGSNLGQTIGPPALAAIAAATGGWTWSPTVLGAAAMIGVAMGFVVRRLERRAS